MSITKVLIHYLRGYDPERYRRCHALLRAAEEGRADLETSTLVIAELIWFLERPPLRLSAEIVRDYLVPILELPALRLPEKRMLQRALELHAESSLNLR